MTKSHRVELTAENYELLKKGAALKGTSMQGLANKLINQFGVADKEEKVILSIPSSLTKRNKDALREWLHVRMEAVVSAFYPSKEHPSNASYFATD